MTTIKVKPKKKKRIIYHNLVTDATYKRRFTKAGRPVCLPLPKLIEKADTIFSLWIRNREKQCVLCGKATDLTNGHCFKRSKKLLRWDEDNCHTLCSGCNKLDNQEHDHYVHFMLKKYGEAKYNEMYRQSLFVLPSSQVREKALLVIKKYG